MNGATCLAANRRIVEQYLNTLGQDRLGLPLLFTDDGTWRLWTSHAAEPVAIRGRALLTEHAAWTLRCFPDWAWTNAQIVETRDPDWLWAECDGAGWIVLPGFPEGFYRNHFLLSFRFRSGRIHELCEFMNPTEQFRELQHR